jgi:peptidoglycan L-alanyl-D-glutamate endopeptidase CwlK
VNKFVLSKNSVAKLSGVHPKLKAVVYRALALSEVDFSVIDGLREYAVQVRYFQTGASKTLKSKHLKQKDGFGHAVDLLPYRSKTQTTEERYADTAGFLEIARAMRQAAFELAVPIRWGGDWDGDGKTRSQGDKDEKFIDYPHFEISLL